MPKYLNAEMESGGIGEHNPHQYLNLSYPRKSLNVCRFRDAFRLTVSFVVERLQKPNRSDFRPPYSLADKLINDSFSA